MLTALRCTEQKEKDSEFSESLRAIDGARTRGLDLGKVARYQLRHYRIRAGDGNRTHVSSLEGWCSTIELHPHVVGVTGFEPATSWSQTRRSSQAEPHPEGFVCVLSVTQELVYSKGENMSTTFFIFLYFF